MDWIENTQTQKKIGRETRANGKKVLADNGFTDQASVDAISSNAEKLYSEYNMLNMECSKKSRKVLSALTAVLGIAGLGQRRLLDISISPHISLSAELLWRRL